MFNPQFEITNKVLTNIVNIEKLLDEIKNLEISNIEILKLKNTSKTHNIFHFAHMISYKISLSDAEKICEGKIYDHENESNLLLNNLRNTLEFIRTSLQDQYIDIDSSILFHINKLLLSNWKEVWDVKFRNPQQIEDNAWNDWIEITDKTIEPLTLQDELKSAFDWYKISTSKIYILIRIAILVFRLIQIAPFSFFNKFTIICATDFLLEKHGYTSGELLPTFRLFDVNNASFITAIEKINIENPKNVTLWVEIFTEALAVELQALKEQLKSLSTSRTTSKRVFLDLNKRQLKILKYLQTIPTIKREDYVQIMEVSSMTAFRDLNDLVTKKLLRIEGRGRATKYLLANR